MRFLRKAPSLLPVLAGACACWFAAAAQPSHACAPDPAGASAPSARRDADGDGIDDADELALAEAFAPVVLHAADDPSLPTNVDAFLKSTRLDFFDAGCDPETIEIDPAPRGESLGAHRFTSQCRDGVQFRSDGTRSEFKQHGFFLTDVDAPQRRGSDDTRQWTTYFHAYPNDLGGVTVQYWLFYPYNTGRSIAVLGRFLELGFHGADWEGVHVVLDRARRPVRLRLLGHRDLTEVAWEHARVEGSHPVVSSGWGSHTSEIAVDDGVSRLRHETWSAGRVTWPDGRVGASGALVNLGEKTRPLQPFLVYSGLWGSVGLNFHRALPGLGIPNVDSGYWGPAYNETGMRADGFVAAWCAGIADETKSVGAVRECFPDARTD